MIPVGPKPRSERSEGSEPAALTLSAESKHARMFVILLTAEESGHVILGTSIDSRGKVCLYRLARGKWTETADTSSLRDEEPLKLTIRHGQEDEHFLRRCGFLPKVAEEVL